MDRMIVFLNGTNGITLSDIRQQREDDRYIIENITADAYLFSIAHASDQEPMCCYPPSDGIHVQWNLSQFFDVMFFFNNNM